MTTARNRVLLWAGVFGALLFLIAALTPGSGPRVAGCRKQSLNQMRQIAAALQLYQADNHGHFPERFSQLVPKYASSPVFYFHCRYGDVAVPPPVSQTYDARLVDVFSPYAFIQLPDGRALVYEHSINWAPKHLVGYCLTTGSEQYPDDTFTGRLPPAEFAEKYLMGFRAR